MIARQRADRLLVERGCRRGRVRPADGRHVGGRSWYYLYLSEQSSPHIGYEFRADKVFSGRRHYLIEEDEYGTKVCKGRFERRRARDEKAQQRHPQKRPQRQEGYEPQAGDRHRPLGSAQGGEESPEEEKTLGRDLSQLHGLGGGVLAQRLEHLGDDGAGVETGRGIHRGGAVLIDKDVWQHHAAHLATGIERATLGERLQHKRAEAAD